MNRRIRKFSMSFIAFLGLAVLGATWATDVTAQSRKELTTMVERLEKEVRALQRRVFPNAQFDEDTQFLEPAGADQSSQRAIMADMEARLISIERQIRLLTGKVEEAEFRDRQLSERLDRMQADMEFRFQQLEEGARNQASVAPQGGAGGTGIPGLRQTLTPEEAEAALEGRLPESAPVETPAVVESGPSGDTPEQQYEFARTLLLRGDFPGAEKAMADFVANHPDHELAANAQYWLGETFYERKDYARAAGAFLTGIQNYGDGNKGPDSLLKLGMSLGALGNTEEACAVLLEMEIRYPGAQDRFHRDAEREASRLNCN